MNRFFAILAAACFLTMIAPHAPAADTPPTTSEILDGEQDANAIRAYLSAQLRTAGELAEDEPDKADRQLDELGRTLEKIQGSGKQAEALLTQGKSMVENYREELEDIRTPLETIGAALLAAPDDSKALRRWTRKISLTISPIARTEPDKAEKVLNDAKAFLVKLEGEAKEDKTRKTLEAIQGPRGIFLQFARAIQNGHKIAALIGQQAAPLQVETWLNGTPLTDDDLKGKVVLIDFWAIWCGPCIATFPDLRRWQAEYGDRGLVIIGSTRYYGYEWDEEAKRAKKADGDVSHEEEQEMLKQFLAHHQLSHRIALRDGEGMSEYYAVQGIPHVVLIDQQGKIRLIRVGSGAKNVAEINALLAELLPGSKANSGK